ncbi:hypothetical protein H9Y04_29145 [Streptomyces sp. TRM66268-LWL]|uniref:Uncharacterized protein n=1 Tax=Streptomyces polyasparticus TaxID=2767826 RepID=A0ABR7SQ07_9ACTN|nr:hypothetical protein [Streptomyces polyasparticus]MBC9716606.1 hypothetical protein [Streptomyces polyasparticus]
MNSIHICVGGEHATAPAGAEEVVQQGTGQGALQQPTGGEQTGSER